MKQFSLSLLLTLFFCAAGVFSQSQGRIEKSMDSLKTSYDGVGLAVAVVKKGKIIYQQSLGYQDLDTGEKLTNESVFRIASISKSFSATAVMQLAEAGKLSLDDEVSDLIGFRVRNPSYPDTRITLRMLLSHTSSLNDSQGYFTLDVIDPATSDSLTKSYNAYKPGSDYQYCNLNFNMVGTIIERVSGQRFDEYIAHHILKPLGLYGGFNVDSLDRNRFATLYEYDKETKKMTASPAAYGSRSKELAQYVAGRSTPVFSPTGGMKISAGDLARYMTMHMNLGKSGKTRIISKKSATLMQTPVPNAKGYGLALWTSDRLIPGVTLKGHTGVAYGLYSMMVFDPDKQYGIVAITNGCNPVYRGDYVAFLTEVVNSLYLQLIQNPASTSAR